MSEMTNITTEASDSPVSNKTVLRLDDVRKSFGNTQVLRGISFDIHQHEVVALLGPSGSGKSTLMKCVNLLEQVDDGQIWVGQDRYHLPCVPTRTRFAHVSGVVFQQFNLFPPHVGAQERDPCRNQGSPLEQGSRRNPRYGTA